MSSWLFGNRKPENFQQYIPQQPEGENNESDKNKEGKVGHAMEAYRFDSEALERAAKAAKDLEKSPFAGQVLDLSKVQEETKQKEVLARAKEIELQIEASKVEGKRVESEERRKTLQEQAKLDQQKAQYQDQLARRRYDDQLAQQQRTNEENLKQQQRMNQENLRSQEESVARQESMRKATIEHEMQQRTKYEAKRQETEIAAKAKYDRENQDLKLEQMKLQSEQDRETTLKSLIEKRQTVLESIKTASSAVGSGLNAFISDPKKVTGAVGGLVALTAGYFTAKGSLGIFFRFLESRLAKPSLVRETSRVTPVDILRHPIQSAKKLYTKKPEDVLSEVVLSPELEERVRDIAIGTKNTKYNKGMYRNILLYGPPGTGKTLFAKKLAMHSGMDYAILTGGDIAMLGRDTVSAIHKVFDWAGTSRKGLILFIDEAEGFLRKRHEKISEDLRMTINAFLYRTGTPTDKFMVVLASNTPEVLDIAIVDRVHEPVNFPLPTLGERERLVRLYFEKYILKPAAEGKRRMKVEEFDYSEACSKVAQMTEGLSAREITNMALDWQMTTYASLEGIFTKKRMLDRAQAAVEHKRRKITWYSTEDLKKSIFSDAVIQAVEKQTKDDEKTFRNLSKNEPNLTS